MYYDLTDIGIVFWKYLDKKINLGKSLRYFDGYQIAKKIGEKRYWRIPVMDGEFICEEYAYQSKGIGGGNFFNFR